LGSTFVKVEIFRSVVRFTQNIAKDIIYRIVLDILYKHGFLIVRSMVTKSAVLLSAIVVVAVVSSLVLSQIEYAFAAGASEFSPGKGKNAEGLRDASDSSPGSQVRYPTDPVRDASQVAPGHLAFDR
jgi:hypothetical protein